MIVFFYNDVPHLIAERAADTVAWCSATLRRNQPQPNRWILHLATLGEFDRSQTAGYSPLGHPVQNLTTAKMDSWLGDPESAQCLPPKKACRSAAPAMRHRNHRRNRN
jgi:hypothetical protein